MPQTTFDSIPATGLIRKSQLIPGILPISSTTLRRMVSSGNFPSPIRLTSKVSVWKAEEIRAYLDSCSA